MADKPSVLRETDDEARKLARIIPAVGTQRSHSGDRAGQRRVSLCLSRADRHRYFDDGTQDFVNCLVSNNVAGVNGGGIGLMNAAEPFFISCTIADNTVTEPWGYGGAISAGFDTNAGVNNFPYLYETFVFLENSIVWDNSADIGTQISLGNPIEMNSFYCTAALSYTTLQGGLENIAIGFPEEYMLAFDLYDGEGPDGEGSVFEEDPFFTSIKAETEASYYLSHTDAGQLEISHCFDLGIDFGYVPDLADFLGTEITTRTDYVLDDNGMLDLGYHYDADKRPLETSYELTLSVDRGGETTQLKGTVVGGSDPFEFFSPETRTVSAGYIVQLDAIILDSTYFVEAWQNTDDDTSTELFNQVTMNEDKVVTLKCDSTSPTLRIFVRESDGTLTQALEGDGLAIPEGDTMWPKGAVVHLQVFPPNASETVRWEDTDDDTLLGTLNTVTMTESKDVIVEFYTPNILDVPGDYTNLYEAVTAAEADDIIILHEGRYTQTQDQHLLITKNLVIQSYNPDDPDVVAGTVLDIRIFVTGTDRKMVFNGLTIEDQTWSGGSPPNCNTCCGVTGDGCNGGSIEGGAFVFVLDASATVKNCRFQDNSASGGNGGDGDSAGDGGWGGWARGGAVYIGSGDPRFINCEFINNFVRGGAGGDAGQANPAGQQGGSYDDPLFPWFDWDFGPYQEYSERKTELKQFYASVGPI